MGQISSRYLLGLTAPRGGSSRTKFHRIITSLQPMTHVEGSRVLWHPRRLATRGNSRTKSHSTGIRILWRLYHRSLAAREPISSRTKCQRTHNLGIPSLVHQQRCHNSASGNLSLIFSNFLGGMLVLFTLYYSHTHDSHLRIPPKI